MSRDVRRFLLYGLGVGLLYAVADVGLPLYVVSSPNPHLKLGRAMMLSFLLGMGLQCGVSWVVARKCHPDWKWTLVGFAMKMWWLAALGAVVAVMSPTDPGAMAILAIFAIAWEGHQAVYVGLAGYLSYCVFRGSAPPPPPPPPPREGVGQDG